MARHAGICPTSSITFVSGWPDRYSITTNERPSCVVPMSLTSMMWGLPIRLAARASRLNRSIASLSSAYLPSMTFTATRLPSSTCVAS